MVGPRAIEFLLNSIVVETDKGSDLRLDLTLLNRFRQNALLQVSLRQSANTPTTIRRDLVNGIRDSYRQIQAEALKTGMRSSSSAISS